MVCGHLALWKIKRQGGTLAGKGLVTAGLDSRSISMA
jgi:hypothetical protein